MALLLHLYRDHCLQPKPASLLCLLSFGLALVMSATVAIAMSSSPAVSLLPLQQEQGELDDAMGHLQEGGYDEAAKLWGPSTTGAFEQSLPNVATTPPPLPPPPVNTTRQHQVIQLDSVARPSYVFPLAGAPLAKFTKDGRQFGAPRDYGRLHAGVDLLEYPGQAVYAITTGKVVNYQYFYEGSYVVTLDHQRFVVRYAEVKKMYGSLRVGDTVQSGQKIGLVAMLLSGSSMLHLEKYTGKLSGPFYVPSSYPYHRRKDLVNPTTFVHSLENSMLGSR